MHPTSPKSLSDMLMAADLILGETAGLTLSHYEANPLLRAGVERWFEILGEAARRVERKDPGIVDLIPDYRTIIDFRNRLAHGYDAVDHGLVWRFIQSELPALRTRVAELLSGVEPSDATEIRE